MAPNPRTQELAKNPNVLERNAPLSLMVRTAAAMEWADPNGATNLPALLPGTQATCAALAWETAAQEIGFDREGAIRAERTEEAFARAAAHAQVVHGCCHPQA